MTTREDRLQSPGGLSIFFRSWHPATTPRGVVVIVHGFNAHSGYYAWAAEQLVAHGLAAYALDLRGRGMSDGERFFVEAFADYVADVATFVTTVKAREPGLPVVLLGHSAGGIVACLYTLEHQRELAGLVCESFAFQVAGAGLCAGGAEGHQSRRAPRARAAPQERGFLERPETGRDHERRSVDCARDATDEDGRRTGAGRRAAQEGIPANDAPVLILHGTADKAARPAGSQLFYDHGRIRRQDAEIL